MAKDISQSPANDEASLIDCVRRGDRAAYKQLYTLHVAMVYGLALRLVNDTQAAEEVTQEVFVRVWRNIKGFEGNSRFSSWLHRVTSNTAIDYLRKQRSWLRLVFDREDAINNVEETHDPMLTGDLQKQIARLPERARLVFVLHAVEGYRHEEIAEMTRMAVGSSKAQLNRAKKLLREWMQNE